MGRTMRRGGPSLEIHHERSVYDHYAPGDTIIGRVSRRLEAISPEATIKLALIGRAKSKMVVSRGNNNRSYYRGRFTIVEQWQTLFQGPLHIASGGTGPGDWPFAFDIPSTCSPKVIGRVPAEQSYLPLDAASVSAIPLPDTFDMEYHGWGTNREGFVEYFLKAMISYTHAGKRESEEAILPIMIRSVSREPPIADFKLRRHRNQCIATSFTLLPGMEDAELSFSQKRQELMGSRKVPRIGGTLEMDIPQVLQLDNRCPVPVQLRFVPNPELTSSGMRGIPVKIKLRSLTATIYSRTTVLCDGSLHPHDANEETESVIRLWPKRVRLTDPPGDPFYIPCTDEYPPIDIGTHVGFCIPQYLSKRTQGPVGQTNVQNRTLLCPDFTTFNIKTSHTIRFDLVADIASQDIKMTASGKLTILPSADTLPPAAPAQQEAAAEEAPPPPPFEQRTESWIQPPPEAEAPPTFAQVQRDDVLRRSFDGRDTAGGKGETAKASA